MPLTLRPKDSILDVIISHLLAGNTVTDINRISVLRQICEGVASTQADLDYDLYTLLQLFYLTTAEGLDLDVRGNDFNLARDPGQAASDTVTITKLVAWIDDIIFPVPTAVEATLADGTVVVYRSLDDVVLRPSGRSVSAQAPGTAITAGLNATLIVNVNGDGPRTLTLGTQTTGPAIAAAIQVAMRALTANNPAQQAAYNTFRADYSITTAGAYTLRSGNAGPSSSVVVTVAGAQDASATLKLGVTQGGTESVGQGSVAMPVVCDQIGIIGNVGAGQIDTLAQDVPGVETVANALAFANGREPASDDAYRQDIRTYILGLGRGTQDAIDRAVAGTLGDDGQKHVLSFQALSGVGFSQIFVCDGRSLTVGSQPDVIQDVQDELDGLGQEPGGWMAAGSIAGVAPVSIVTVNVSVIVTLGPTPDLTRAQTAITNSIYSLVYNWPVGQALSYSTVVTRIDQTVVEMLGVEFSSPAVFASNPPLTLGSGIGQKVMPGSIVVNVLRA